MSTRRTVSALVLATLASSATGLWAGVAGSKHDLSTLGPGPYRASEESRVCRFCHVPHSGAPKSPLWGRPDSGRIYKVYRSSTARAEPGQPSNGSRWCLSCHDGTVALGAMRGGHDIAMAPGRERLESGRGRLGSDLSDDHPVGVDYREAALAAPGRLRPAATLDEHFKLDPDGRVQCGSCHDPHDNRNTKFLSVDPSGGALCLGCHAPAGWEFSSHATSPATWTGEGDDPFAGEAPGTVADKACRGCHVSHQAGRPERLLAHDREEQNCLACHNGWVAQTDIRNELTKASAHRADLTTGVHDPTEDPATMAQHVECSDCHDPHQVGPSQHGRGNGPGGLELPRALEGAPGVTDTGAPVRRASSVREVCYRCHGDHGATTARRIVRARDETSIRRKFDAGNASFHPVGQLRGIDGSRSLLPSWQGGQMTCTHCHDSDASPAVGGSGPRGPHGSRWSFMLGRQYATQDGTPESPQAYGLCYSCHDRASLLNDESFPHQEHVVDQRTSCAVCHDPHGVPSGGVPDEGRALVNFDTWVVEPVGGVRRFQSSRPGKGNCTLRCHGQDHNALSYDTGG